MKSLNGEETNEPLVCVIILNWNGYDFTAQCLESLQHISYPNYIIVIVDNGSTDGSVQKLHDRYDSKVDVVSLSINEGFAKGNNIGANYAIRKYNPGYILLLNNDTVVKEDFLSKMVYTAENIAETSVVVPKIMLSDDPKRIWYAGGRINRISGLVKQYGRGRIDNLKYSKRKDVSFMNGCSPLIKTEVIQQIGLFDEIFFATSEDADFSLRIAKQGTKIIYEPDAIVYHKVGISQEANKGQWFSFYLATRSVILLKRKYSKFPLLAISIIYLMIRWVLYLELKFLLMGEYKICVAIFYGLYDGFNGHIRFR
jgi:hypothetical protein